MGWVMRIECSILFDDPVYKALVMYTERIGYQLEYLCPKSRKEYMPQHVNKILDTISGFYLPVRNFSSGLPFLRLSIPVVTVILGDLSQPQQQI